MLHVAVLEISSVKSNAAKHIINVINVCGKLSNTNNLSPNNCDKPDLVKPCAIA